MREGDFLRLDHEHEGGGLTRGSRQEREWSATYFSRQVVVVLAEAVEPRPGVGREQLTGPVLITDERPSATAYLLVLRASFQRCDAAALSDPAVS